MNLLADGDSICEWPRIYVPESCQNVEIVIGIDEAGRGAVLGSLIYTAAFWPKSMHEEMCKLGYDDSKQLKEGERDRFFEGIKSNGNIGWVIGEMSAEFISANMLKPTPISLNQLSYNTVVWCLERIKDYGISGATCTPRADSTSLSTQSASSKDTSPIVNELYIDTVGDPETYKQALIRGLGYQHCKDWKFIIEKKADATYPVVSCASIVAKVTRDCSIKAHVWKEKCLRGTLPTAATTTSTTTTGNDENESSTSKDGNNKIVNGDNALSLRFGSGYPSDPKCVEWLAGPGRHPVFGYPNFVRFSWGTTVEALSKHNSAKVTYACDEEGDNDGNTAITLFFQSAPSASSNKSDEGSSEKGKGKRPQRSAFFVRKAMKHVLPSEL